MNLDKTLLKRTIDQTRPQDLLVLQVNQLEKGSVNTHLKTIEKFMNSKDDYVIIVMRRWVMGVRYKIESNGKNILTERTYYKKGSNFFIIPLP